MDKFKDLIAAAETCPHQTWAAFTDDSGSKPHTNLVSFTGQTEYVLALPGLHKNDPLVAYLWAAQPAAILALIEQRDELQEALAFYADESGWNAPPVKTVENELFGRAYENQASKIRADRGRVARAAIAKIIGSEAA